MRREANTLNHRRPLALVGRLAALFLFCFWAQPALSEPDPAAFISNLASKAIPVLTDDTLPQEERETRFRELMHEGFDVRTIGELVLARYWRRATPEQQDEFVQLLEDYIVQVYSARFKEYSDVSLRVNGTRPSGESSIVQSTLVRAQGAPVALDWRVREQNGELKITDIMVEGVSMVITQRSEFASVIRQGGGEVQALIDVLRQKVGA